MELHYFLFDLDGTLIDSNEAILVSLREVEERLNLPPLPQNTLNSFLGPPLKQSFINHYHVSPIQADHMTDIYRECYLYQNLDRTVVFEGVPEFLAHIRARGGKTALATLKEYHLAEEILSHSGLDKLFDHVSLNKGNSGKDKTSMLLECLSSLSCPCSQQAVMFGDSPYDGLAAASAGTRFVPLLWGAGFQAPGSLDGLDCLYAPHTPQEMDAFIRSVI